MIKRLWLILIISVLCCTPVAMGATASFTPPVEDHSLKYISDIFGNVGGFNADWAKANFTSPLKNMFDVFNHVILIFGVIVILYTTIVAALNTAYHGKMMGDKWSSLWIPIRVVLGFALLVPQANGYAMIQSLVMWLVIQSVGAADSLWNVMVDNMKGIATSTPTITEPPYPLVLDRDAAASVFTRVVRPVFLSMVCFRLNYPATESTMYTTSYSLQGDLLITFRSGNKGNCGTITIKKDNTIPADKVAMLQTFQESAIRGIALDVKALAGKVADIGYSNDLTTATNKLTTEAIITQAVSVFKTAIDKYADKIYTPFRTKAITVGAPETVNSTADLLKKEGWIYAGSYYMLLGNTASPDAKLKVPLYTESIDRSGGVGANYDEPHDLAEVVRAYNTTYNQLGLQDTAISGTERILLNATKVLGHYLPALEPVAAGGTRSGIDTTQSLGQQAIAATIIYYSNPSHINAVFSSSVGSDPATELWKSSIKDFMNLTQVDLITAANKGEDPMAILARYGRESAYKTGEKVKEYHAKVRDWAIADAVVQPIATGLGDFAGGIAGGLAAPGPAIGAAIAAGVAHGATIPTRLGLMAVSAQSTAVIGIALAFFAQAAMLGIFVPLIPFVIFAMGVLGWFMIVIEAMVAAPIVALGATIPEGNEIYGKAIPALMLVANLFLRPMLMLFGLYGAVLLSGIVIIFFTQGFDLVFNRTLLPPYSLPNVFYWTAVIFMYAAFLSVIIQRCFSLIGHLPDRVLRWIGDTSSGMGTGEEALGEMKGGARAGADMGASSASSGIQAEQKMGEAGGIGAAGTKGAGGVGKRTGKHLEEKRNKGAGVKQNKPTDPSAGGPAQSP